MISHTKKKETDLGSSASRTLTRRAAGLRIRTPVEDASSAREVNIAYARRPPRGTLKIRPSDVDHFLYVAFNELSYFENSSGVINCDKEIKFLFYFYYSSERNETGGDLRC